MLIYRYRSNSELAMKELIYNELFFASAEECNDPYDGKDFLVFGKEIDKWKRLFETAWKDDENIIKNDLAEKMSQKMLEYTPLSFEQAILFCYSKEISSILNCDLNLASFLESKIKNLIEKYSPKKKYFASFSKNNASILMWSHYASMHHGFCLIYKSINGGLDQDPGWKRSSVRRKTKNGIAPTMKYSFPQKFIFEEIVYQEKTEQIDAFSCFTSYIYGNEIEDEKERLNFVYQKEKQYLEKHDSWKYEEEVRLLLPTPPASMYGEHFSYTQNERLLHYSPTQLVGIILGSRMERNQKDRICEICQERLDKIALSCKNSIVFDFVLFQAKLENDYRGISIEPKTIFSLGGTFYESDVRFIDSYKLWKDGWALVFRDKGCSKKKID
ncbi:DUF2971 domain-containing protein [Acetobacterium woodii]|uniref:DUF2971 domain-containing protein n=1 Tax=Acetobacterium woodii (strain ATCC 29683 / DSM 1030 / JCM 2381 / KCTC 1655 / WB1) TaxID=931626 RepID=H6LFL1_ACEWD|nr:DUF2971 domain-containing protein [Acetobacterium woodii]AFA46956.1 hypothetical protein Awo_c01470 [Acetobacterium woodii DSM 1030]